MEGEEQEGAVGGDQALTSFNISEAELIGNVKASEGLIAPASTFPKPS